LDVSLTSDIVKLEAFKVSETSKDTTFDSSSMGTGSSFTPADIASIESVRRDLQDIQNLDPRAVVTQVSASDPAYSFSVSGQNPRENQLLVDGVSAADNFGLNSNGYAGLRNPIPLDWISNLTLQVNPFDTIYSGFLGAITDISLSPAPTSSMDPPTRSTPERACAAPTRWSACLGPMSPPSSTRPASRSAARSSRTSCSSHRL